MVTLQVMNLIGDVRGKVAVMVDDMIDTAGESFFYRLTFLFVSPSIVVSETNRITLASPSTYLPLAFLRIIHFNVDLFPTK